MDISVTSMDDAFAQDKVNTAFRSLYNQMATYEPDTTDNNFADFSWCGCVQNGFNGSVEKPAQEVPLIGMTDSGLQVNIGYISTNGEVVFYDLDKISSSELSYDMSWQCVDINLIQAADFGNATFQIGGDGPVLNCNCLLKPCVWDNINCQTLSSVPYCYDYCYYYGGACFYWNDGSQPNNIMGWTIVGSTYNYITTDNYCACLLTCTCCCCDMNTSETCRTADGTVWVICNQICSWCVYETWQTVPTGVEGAWACTDPLTGICMIRPALWSWNGSNNFWDLAASDWCVAINFEKYKWCSSQGRGNCLNGLSESQIYQVSGSMHNTSQLETLTNWQLFNRHFKYGGIAPDGHYQLDWSWNPNNEYWDRCFGFCTDARCPYSNAVNPNIVYWKSPTREYASCFCACINEGINGIPYNKEIYELIKCCWDNCGLGNTYNMWIGGNYIDYSTYTGYYNVDTKIAPPDLAIIISCFDSCCLAKTKCMASSGECPHCWINVSRYYTNYINLYGQCGGNIFPMFTPPWWAQLCCPNTWNLCAIPADCYCADSNHVWGCNPLAMIIQTWDGHQTCKCEPGPLFRAAGTNLSRNDCFVGTPNGWLSSAREGWINGGATWFDTCPLYNYNPWLGFKYNLDSWGCKGSYDVVEQWWTMWCNWMYAPYSYCRLTKQFCVHRTMTGTKNFEIGPVSIRVRYRKA